MKSGETRTSGAKSQADIQRLLRRYGATGFQCAQDYTAGKISVTFTVPDAPGSARQVPVYLPVDVVAIANRLHGARHAKREGFSVTQWERAERVAWRHLVLWIDAALTAASVGLQTITEAFFAHTVVGVAEGRAQRMIERVGRELRLLGTPAGDASIT